jgi:hypothetical protein
VTPADKAARERKQKIFVAVGGLFLVALLAFQLPKLLHHSSSPSATPAATTTEGTGSTPVPGGTNVVATSLVRPSGLTSFSRLGGKDPFVQQVKFSQAAASSGPTGASGGKEGGKKGADAKSSTQKFTTGTQPTASMTVISVNGARQALSAGSRFPAADPVFVLVSEDQKKKSVVVGVAGGAYTSGSRTTKLVAGKPLVLVNTTTGARYKLVLVAVGNGESASKGDSASKGEGAKSGDSAASPKSSSTP